MCVCVCVCVCDKKNREAFVLQAPATIPDRQMEQLMKDDILKSCNKLDCTGRFKRPLDSMVRCDFLLNGLIFFLFSSHTNSHKHIFLSKAHIFRLIFRAMLLF